MLSRPVGENGFGLDSDSLAEIHVEVSKTFKLLDDVPGVYANWLSIVESHAVMGKKVHDANHVAAMQTHAVEHVITFDRRDFGRFAEIKVVVP